jgi:hypothetical protein
MCIFCDHGHQPIKLHRQWVHHFPRLGQLIVCPAMEPKPGS